MSDNFEMLVDADVTERQAEAGARAVGDVRRATRVIGSARSSLTDRT
jgi:hypothetical protein